MNGIKNEDLPLIKRQKHIKLLKFRFFICLILSNLFIFLLSYRFEDQDINIDPVTNSLHDVKKDHVLLSLPLKNYALLSHDFPVDVVILNKKNQIIIKQARLFPQSPLIKENIFESLEEEKQNIFTLEIPKESLQAVINSIATGLISWPYHQYQNNFNQGTKYEIIF